MCGRFTLTANADTLQSEFNLSSLPADLAPRYNIAPSQPVAVALRDGQGGQYLDAFRWGLIPAWAKDAAIGSRMINARAETVASKPSFKRPLQKQRCLILADGFFEWQKTPGGKLPAYFRLQDGRPFAFAGLWDSWTDPAGQVVHSCAIITTAPNSFVSPIHKRMPVILPPEDRERWLNPIKQQPQALLPLLKPYPANKMLSYPVSTLVNSPANDSPACIQPLARLF